MSEQPERRRHFVPPPPGYFRCKHLIEKLEKYQDLVRYDVRRSAELARRPLEELIDKDEKIPTFLLLEREIRRLSPIVSDALEEAHVGMILSYTEEDLRIPGDPERRFQSIVNTDSKAW